MNRLHKNGTSLVQGGLFLILLILLSVQTGCFLFPVYSPLEILSHGVPELTYTAKVFFSPQSNADHYLNGWIYSLDSTYPEPHDSRWCISAPSLDLPDYGSYTIYLWARDLDGQVSRRSKAVTTYKAFSGDWTFMIWMDGDNNLELNALGDMHELEAGFTVAKQSDPGLADKLAVVVQLDRIGGYTSLEYGGEEDWTDCRRYQITGDSPGLPPVRQLTAGKEINMGDPENLKDFIRYCKNTFPAENYALIIWNHGGGVINYEEPKILTRTLSLDITDDSDFLYIAEITDCLGDDEDVDLIGFDTCFIGTVEIAYEYRPASFKFGADYFVASPAAEQNDGWDYQRILTRLKGGGTDAEGDPCYDLRSLQAAQLARLLVKEYKDSQRELSNAETLTALDLSLVDEVKTALDLLAAELVDYRSECEDIRGYDTHTASLEYFDEYSIYAKNDWLQYPHFDLYDFAARIAADADHFSSLVRDKAELLMNALYNCILDSYGGNRYDSLTLGGAFTPRRNGLAIFFPDGNGISNIGGIKYYYLQWGYTHLDTNAWKPGHYYGKLDFCDSDSDFKVETWRELLELWFDGNSSDPEENTPGSW